MRQVVHKAPGGIIRVDMETEGDVIKHINITGDFFMSPEEALEELEAGLKGAPAQGAGLLKVIEAFYKESGVESPGIEAGDIVKAIEKALPGRSA